MPAQRSSSFIAVPSITTFKQPQALIENALMSGFTTYMGDYGSKMGVWDPISQQFFIFAPTLPGSWQRSGTGSNWRAGADFNAGFTAVITLWCTYSNSFVTLLGGKPDIADTHKVLYTIDGANWSNNAIGGSDTEGVTAIGYSSSLNMFFASCSSTGLYSATPALDWTLRQATANGIRNIITREGSSPVLLAMGFNSSSIYYYRSTDGITWTNTSLPVSETYGWGCWSDWYGKFYITTANGLYSSLDGSSWTSVNTAVPEYQIIAHEHLLIRADGVASRDGGVHWRRVADYNGAVSPNLLNVSRGLNGRVLFREDTALRVTSGYLM